MFTVLVTAGVTVACVFVAINMTGGGKPIKRQMEHLYSVNDPQFQRTMRVMLGPVILPGNGFQVYVNGDESFPPMLEAIANEKNDLVRDVYLLVGSDR
jgi:cardiolipin synthase